MKATIGATARLFITMFAANASVAVVSGATPERVIEGAHTTIIVAAAIDSQSKVIASASWEIEAPIKLWHVETGAKAGTFKGHDDWVVALAFHPGKDILVSASLDKTIKFWALPDGKNTLTLKGHTERLNAIEFSADGKWLVSASKDMSVALWRTSALGIGAGK
ncbi:MAG: WD40 repeat domain-containing protein [Verrucomicrobiales bacterium]